MLPPLLRRLLILVAAGSALLLIALLLNPVNSTLLRLAFLAALGGVWLCPLVLLWSKPPYRYALLALPLLSAVPFLLPAREIDRVELRADYVRRMAEFEGTPYAWGGENARGIDCSGLPRRALRDSLLSYGLRHLNGGAIRKAASHWWFDASAKALGEGYRGYTVPLDIEGTIESMEYGALQPGDLAVMSTGVHIVAYAGDGKWIQADPGIRSVEMLDGKKDENGWFRAEVTTHRWKVLDYRR